MTEQLWRSGTHTLRPFCAATQIKPRGCSRRLQRALTDFGADHAFGAAAKKVQEHYGVSVPAERVRTVTLHHAHVLAAQVPALNADARQYCIAGQTVVPLTGSQAMPAVTARMQELDGMIAKTAAAVESSVAVVRALEPLVADRQKEVDAAIGQLLSLQGVPEAPHEPEGVTSDADRE